jgi:glycosyltransferase involved in cell wall biosynthesis
MERAWRPLMATVAHLTSVHSASDTRIFLKECKSLAGAGYDVVFIAPKDQDQVVDGVQIRAIPKARRRAERMTKTVGAVYRAAIREKADLYHFHDPELIPVGLLLRLRGKSVVYDVHEDVPQQILSKHYLPRWLRGFVGGPVRLLENFAAGRFSALVTATPHIAKRFGRLNPRVLVLQNFPLLGELVGDTLTIPWQRRDTAVAYVGGITVARGIREMVTAFSLLPEDYAAELHLAGIYSPENLRGELVKARGWERVRELGFLDRSGVREALGKVKAGLVLITPEPRYQVAWPVKMFEYMSAGIPVIVSGFPLWRSIVEVAGCGILVDPLDSRAIADAIKYLLDHPEEAEAMGQRGRRAVEELYNWKTEEKKLLALYRELLLESPS